MKATDSKAVCDQDHVRDVVASARRHARSTLDVVDADHGPADRGKRGQRAKVANCAACDVEY